MATVEKSIVVNAPIRTVYDQWTQFEEFPKFMEGVESVRQMDDKTLHWRATVKGKTREWDARITEQKPDRLICWRSTSGARNDGTVTFSDDEPGTTRVDLRLDYEPADTTEKAGEALGFLDRQVDADLKRFKEFIESRGTPTGAWRGKISGERVEEREDQTTGR